MTRLWFALVTLILALPLGAAEIIIDGLPDNTVWYMHADLEEMRNSESGSRIYKWFEGEVVVEVNEKLGIDLNSEVNSITAFQWHRDDHRRANFQRDPGKNAGGRARRVDR